MPIIPHYWLDTTVLPENSRTVVVKFDNGDEVEAFYWRPEKQWYRKDGYRDEDSWIEPVAWRERTLE